MDLETYALLNGKIKNITENVDQIATEATEAWLEDNVDPDTGYVLDRTLSMSNAAAPADLVGAQSAKIEDIDELKRIAEKIKSGNLINFDDYLLVDWIGTNESSMANVKIDTGLKLGPKLKTVLDMRLTDISASNFMGREGVNSGYIRNAIGVNPPINPTKFYFAVGNENLALGTLDTKRHTFFIDVPNLKYGLDNEVASKSSFTYGSTYSTISVYLFGVHASSIISKAEIYGARFYNDGVLVAYFVPVVKKSNGQAGLYDVIRDGFYTKSGANYSVGYASTTPLTEEVAEVLEYSPKYNMEYGGIGLSDTTPTYASSTTRVRTMEKVTIPLAKNDVISLDANNIVMYVGWKNRSNEWKNTGAWVTGFTMPEDGDTVFVLRYSTETSISNIESITSKIKITRHNSLYGEYGSNVIKNKRRDFFIKTVSHRGFARYAPENTIPAFKLSSYLGFDCVETDVRFTSDGVAVCLHDASINRTARNADGTELSSTVNIADITYEQALTYDFGIRKGQQFAGTKIPTFEEFMMLCKKLAIHPYVEIKDGTGTHLQTMVNIAKKCAMLKNTTWISYSYTDLQGVLTLYPSARVGLVGDVGSSTIATLSAMKTDDNEVFMDADISNLTDQNISDLMDADIPLEVFTINSITTANSLDGYVSGISADYYNLGYEIYSLNMDDVFGTRTVVIT